MASLSWEPVPFLNGCEVLRMVQTKVKSGYCLLFQHLMMPPYLLWCFFFSFFLVFQSKESRNTVGERRSLLNDCKSKVKKLTITLTKLQLSVPKLITPFYLGKIVQCQFIIRCLVYNTTVLMMINLFVFHIFSSFVLRREYDTRSSHFLSWQISHRLSRGVARQELPPSSIGRTQHNHLNTN